jgi:hypothetical protein
LGPALAAPKQAPTSISLAPAAWRAAPADGVELALAAATGPDGQPALRLDYDFHGHGGWAAARHPLDLTLPPSYEIRFRLRGTGTANRLEVKLVGRSDPAGENVWWHVDPAKAWPSGWTTERIKKRQVSFAWGPAGGGEPSRLGAVEIAITAGGGGRGSLWLADLEIVRTEPPSPPAGPPRASATSAAASHPASAALDGDPASSWRPSSLPAALTVDLRGLVELGGLSFTWEAGREPERFRVELSEDGSTWEPAHEVVPEGAAESHLRLPDAEARQVRVSFEAGSCPRECGLARLVVRPLAFGASDDAFVEGVAAGARRGAFPRAFSGQAVYWTVVGRGAGETGAPEEALLSEDGALETGAGGFSLEPFVLLSGEGGGTLRSWADEASAQSLAEGDLPLPTVTWRLGGTPAVAGRGRLDVQPLVVSEGDRSALLVRYRIRSDGAGGPDEVGGRRAAGPLQGTLFLAARPFQVDPPYQTLNLKGGVAPIRRITCADGGLLMGGDRAVVASPAPSACGARAFDQPLLTTDLAAERVPPYGAVEDPVGLASGVLAWPFDLAPGQSLEVIVATPLADAPSVRETAGGVGVAGIAPADDLSRLVGAGPAGFAAARIAARKRWRAALGPLELDLPDSAASLLRTLRSSVAWNLIHRDGAALQPGSRSYARSWIRDGAMTAEALLRMGRSDVARAYAEWFAGFQYADGKVPCCVDWRGADPVAENDSPGELIHLIAEVYRYTGDRVFAERTFPHLEAAVSYLETLRRKERTAAHREPSKLAFFGLLPESISHEGYSAHPVHSYWDDAWAYRGLADAAALASELGKGDLSREWAADRDEFRSDLLASIARVREHDYLAYLPGSAELGDFDSTSTTVLLDPAGLLPYLPRKAVDATFERFWKGFVARRDGAKDWDAYTPYEIRQVGAFVRLGWVRRAHELLAYYLADRRPLAWNGWPEVVTRDPREPRFLGDLPHGWVASDFIRSVLDLFAYEERDPPGHERLVLGAGVPAAWLERPEGIAVRHLATPWGELSYRLERLRASARAGAAAGASGGVRYRLERSSGPGARPLEAPPGGLVFTLPGAGGSTGGGAAPGRVGRALVDGRSVEPGPDGRVVVHEVPATVELFPAEPRAGSGAVGGPREEAMR